MSRYSVTFAPIDEAAVEIRGDAAAAGRVLAQAKLEAPSKPNTARATGTSSVLWLGPRRWLVLAPREVEGSLATALEAASASEPLALAANVSDMLTGFAVRGAGAADVVAQGTPLDLEALPPDAATMTDLFAVPALVRPAAGGFDVWIDRSLAGYVEECLAIANGMED